MVEVVVVLVVVVVVDVVLVLVVDVVVVVVLVVVVVVVVDVVVLVVLVVVVDVVVVTLSVVVDCVDVVVVEGSSTGHREASPQQQSKRGVAASIISEQEAPVLGLKMQEEPERKGSPGVSNAKALPSHELPAAATAKLMCSPVVMASRASGMQGSAPHAAEQFCRTLARTQPPDNVVVVVVVVVLVVVVVVLVVLVVVVLVVVDVVVVDVVVGSAVGHASSAESRLKQQQS